MVQRQWASVVVRKVKGHAAAEDKEDHTEDDAEAKEDDGEVEKVDEKKSSNGSIEEEAEITADRIRRYVPHRGALPCTHA